MADDPNNTKAAFDKNWVLATEDGNGGSWALALIDTRDALLGGCRAALELDQGGQKSYAFPAPEFWFPRDRLRWVNALNPSMRREDFPDHPWPWELRAYLLPSELRELFHSEALPPAREQGSTLPVFLHRADAIQWGLLPSAAGAGEQTGAVAAAIGAAATKEDDFLPASEATRSKRGRRAKMTPELERYIFKLLDHHGLPSPDDPDWSSQADVEKIIQDRAGLGETQAREHAHRLIDTWKARKGEEAGN
jgi:hypothetical protein